MTVSISLAELATQIGAKIEGTDNGDLLLKGITSLKQADNQQVSFFSNILYREQLTKTHAAAVILANKNRRFCKVPMLVMENPYLGYARAASFFHPQPQPVPSIHPTAYVSPQACLDSTVSIGPQAVIEAGVTLGRQVQIGAGCIVGCGVEIGAESQLRANATLCPGTHLGQRVIIHSGAVLGADGFGIANDDGQWVKVPQLGGIRIADDVEIGANTTIDKGALEDTVIGPGVKLDNQIQIAHNVHIGDHTAIAGCVGIAGSTRIGRYCMIGGGVGISGHLELVDYVHITGGSIVLQSISKPGVYSSGTPLQPNQRWHRNYQRFKHLDEMARRLQVLEQTNKGS
jgi:UDP-3-O-[3-hydroxymyristoyl] glucosamine N-acyltransferase